MKKFIPVTLLLLTLLTGVSCRKKDKGPAPGMEITPELLGKFGGRNWAEVEPLVSNKKDYVYTAGTDPRIKADVVVPGTDPDMPGKQFRLVLNINRDNVVSYVGITSAGKVSTEDGNKLMLHYYRRVFSLISSINYQQASYDLDQSRKVTLNELLDKLETGTCPQPNLELRNMRLQLRAAYFPQIGGGGAFDASLYAF